MRNKRSGRRPVRFSGGRSVPLLSAKVALALVAVLVMSLTGYAWASLQGMVEGLTVADVISDEAGGTEPDDGSRDILLVGLDSRTDAQGNPVPDDVLNDLDVGEGDGELNTDTIILVHVPNDEEKATAVSIPRDSYVDVPGFGKHKVNSAYARGKAAEEQQLRAAGETNQSEIEVKSDQAGAKTLVETVQALTGRTIDNYASVNLLGFLNITEAVGGVEVCLNNDVDDYDSGADFDAGVQTISGRDALAFVRQRHGLERGDLDRVVRQQVFLAGLANKVISAGTLADPDKLSGLVNAVQKSVILDQDWNIMEFAEQMSGLTGGEIEFHTIPVTSANLSTPDGSAVEVDTDQVRNFFAGLSGETDADSGDRGQTESNADTTVNVMNTTNVAGLAADVSDELTAEGFTEGLVSNAGPRDTTVVRHAPGEQDSGRLVADALEGPAQLQEDSGLGAGVVTVMLGTDYPDNAVSAEPGGGRSAQNLEQNPGPDPGQDPGEDTGPAPQDSESPSEDDEPITADGVTCVN